MAQLSGASASEFSLPTPEQIQRTIPGRVGVTSEHQGWRNIVFNEMIFARQASRGEAVLTPNRLHRMGLIYRGHIKGETAIDRGSWRKSTLVGGDLYMLTAEHEAQWAWSTMGRDQLHYLGFHFAPTLLQESVLTVFDKDPDAYNLDVDLRWRDPVLSQLIASIYMELRQDHHIDPLYIESVSQFISAQILHYLNRQKLQLKPIPKKGLSPQALKRVIDFIDANLSQRITIAQLAEQVNMSVYHFVRMFKQATSVTPHQHIIQQRMQRADQLLQKTNLSITQVGIEVGYESASNFSAAYKKLRGVSPKAYRDKQNDH